MNSELKAIAEILEQATTPEVVFGEIQGENGVAAQNLKRAFRQLARKTHPDMYANPHDRLLAQSAFARLTSWLVRAEAKLRAGTYGRDRMVTGQTLKTKKRLYFLEGGFEEGQVYNRYSGWFEDDGQPVQVILKLARDPADNDLAQNEAQVVQALRSGKQAAQFNAYIPRLVEAFSYQAGGCDRQGNVFEQPQGWYTLEEVRRVYPNGVDAKDMAWMWRRLLSALGFAHHRQVIHGAVLPANIAIQAEAHGLVLREWSFAVDGLRSPGGTIPAMDPQYEAWYFDEVGLKQSPLPGTDIGMAARCMVYLLGGDPIRQVYPDSVPGAVRMFLKGCMLPGKKSRPQDAWALVAEFDALIQRLWGERKFHPFVLK
jgi:hypothetical protein